MKIDDKFKNIKTRSNKSLIDQLVSTAERSDAHRSEDQIRTQLRECAILAHELQKREEINNLEQTK